MTYAELFETMSDLSVSSLESKQFGKKRTQQPKEPTVDSSLRKSAADVPKELALDSTSEADSTSHSRYVSKALKHQVWQRDKWTCTICGGQRHIQYDHIKPFALGGSTTLENLRLLCFQCNQRASIKVFGMNAQKHSRCGTS